MVIILFVLFILLLAIWVFFMYIKESKKHDKTKSRLEYILQENNYYRRVILDRNKTSKEKINELILDIENIPF